MTGTGGDPDGDWYSDVSCKRVRVPTQKPRRVDKDSYLDFRDQEGAPSTYFGKLYVKDPRLRHSPALPPSYSVVFKTTVCHDQGLGRSPGCQRHWDSPMSWESRSPGGVKKKEKKKLLRREIF